MRPIALVLLLALAAPAVAAQTLPSFPPQNDQVVLSLTTEDWVQTQTARTEVSIEAALPGSDAGKVRSDMQSAVKGLASAADWRFTQFDRTADSAGLERWRAVLEARLPETQLGGLADRAKSASKPGLQLHVQSVDFTPTLAETEAVRGKLRGDLYKRATEELTRLNQALPDRKYRIARIDFMYGSASRPMPLPQMKTAMADASFATAQPVEVAQKIQLTATVTLSAFAPKSE